MTMTHYMELLATNQPWNLIIFMAIPVILAETVAITELYILFTRKINTFANKLNRFASIVGGIYFTGIFIYLMNKAFIPLTLTSSWRGPADFIAVTTYLLGVIPLVGIALIDLNLLNKNKNNEEKLKLHSIFVAIFLIVAHIAMIFGMLNPDLLTHKNEASTNHEMMNM